MPVIARVIARSTLLAAFAAGALPPGPTRAQQPPTRDIVYDVTFDRTTAAVRGISVTMSFDVAHAGPVVLSLPAWTPGSYEIDDFARYVGDVDASRDGTPIRWDKTDYDSWRVFPAGSGRVSFDFTYRADTLDTGMAGSFDDFAFFNGTNLFPYPEGGDFEFPATVRIHTEADWRIATGMRAMDATGTYAAVDYHELVDMPFFVGRFDLDSLRVDGRWYRLATYPSGIVSGQTRAALWADIAAMMPPMAAVFDTTPWDAYTILALFDEGYPGGSALEHGNSHLGIYTTAAVGSATLTAIVAHEIFHAWNVKRLRPEDLWPYRYDRAQPTTLLWVSEGITDYYADLAQVRGGIWDAERFYEAVARKIATVEEAGSVSLEDASLSTWIDPVDGTGYIYYDKGSAAGLLLDILIRDATANRGSLDLVMRRLYQREYEQGSGFTEAEWWEAVEDVAGGRDLADFRARYLEGRDAYPWDELLPLAGLRLERQTTRRPIIDVAVEPDSTGFRITRVAPGSAAAASGFQVGDYILAIGDIDLVDQAAVGEFFRRYATAEEGGSLTVRLRRGDAELAVQTGLEFSESAQYRVAEDPRASPGAVRVREALLAGGVQR
jgi:predicted metalloprotease with PDZ domain